MPHYLEISLQNNPGILQKLAEYEASLQKIPQVGGLPDPELSTGIFLSPMELVGGKQLADIRLMQMFPWFGVLKNAKDEMSLMAKAKYELFRDAKLQLCYDVQQTWFEMYKNAEAIAVSENNKIILQSLERLALVKFKAGSSGSASSTSAAMPAATAGALSPKGSSGMNAMGGSQPGQSSGNSAPPATGMQQNASGSGLADLYRIQMEASELNNGIAQLKSNLMALTARFNSFLNRQPQQFVALPDTIRQTALDLPLQAVADSILANNPMLGMLKNEQESLESRQQMVSRMGYPMIGLGVNYSLINKNPMSTAAMNGKDMIMPMVVVTLPIYRKKYAAMQKEAELLKTAATQGIKSTENALRDEFYSAIQAYQDAQSRMKLYRHQLQLAEQSLNILTKSYASSGAGLTDLLRVRQQTLDFHLKLVDAVADYNTAIAKMKRLGNME